MARFPPRRRLHPLGTRLVCADQGVGARDEQRRGDVERVLGPVGLPIPAQVESVHPHVPLHEQETGIDTERARRRTARRDTEVVERI